MTSQELRRLFIDFFVDRGHREISGYSVVPNNDPSVLFTTAGMHPLAPYFLGQKHPAGNRIVNVQKCIRTGDIEEVGDTQHLTFFEMLGNWSFGDYWKEQMICYSYEFITSKKYLGINPNLLFTSIFEGDDYVMRDIEAEQAWYACGLSKGQTFACGRKNNWWGPVGKTGPCGPDTEMFFDTQISCGFECRTGCLCGRYLEFWNDVFMQYEKKEDGSYVLLTRKNIDTGMGLERVLALMQGKTSVYETELFQPLLDKIGDLSGVSYSKSDESFKKIFRIIVDHMRSITMILGDDSAITPSNTGQGYILRRLIRRVIRMGRKLDIGDPFLKYLADMVLVIYEEPYPRMKEKRNFICDTLMYEEKSFELTLEEGEREFRRLLLKLKNEKCTTLSGKDSFRLYDTFGFPIELTAELAKDQGFSVDTEGFKIEFSKHQQLSKKGSDRVFQGGLSDHSEISMRYHTATHLLNAALRKILGNHVCQQGSNITVERMRYDFAHIGALTSQQIEQVENLVNKKISENLFVHVQSMDLTEAQKIGAQAMFIHKYDEAVKVYFIGDFSIEVCGGPHVTHTNELGKFKIVKEQASSRGVRRIRAILIENDEPNLTSNTDSTTPQT